MTCIVGVEHEGSVYIAGDSASVDGGFQIFESGTDKVFVNGPMLMGYTTSWRMGQLLRYAVTPPYHDPRHDDMRYLVVDFIDAVRSSFKDKGWLTKESDVESGGDFLLGYKDRLYRVSSDFQVNPNRCGYGACGCGESYALGALHAIKNSGKKTAPEDVLRRALEAAAFHSAGVIGPFLVMRIRDGHAERLAGDTWEEA